MKAPLAAFVLSICLAGVANAQAPIERRPPTPLPAAPRPALMWPDAGTVQPGDHLLVTSFYRLGSHECSVVAVDDVQLACKGPHYQVGASYERSMVDTIEAEPRNYAGVKIAKTFTAELGGIALGFSLLCGADGGACKTPAFTGLSLLGAAGVLQIVEWRLHFHDRKLLYRATLADYRAAHPRPFPF